eukprot:11492429-Heterocapsa_arctica.AAC.1
MAIGRGRKTLNLFRLVSSFLLGSREAMLGSEDTGFFINCVLALLLLALDPSRVAVVMILATTASTVRLNGSTGASPIEMSSIIFPATPVKPTSIQALHAGVPSTRSLMVLRGREVAGDDRMRSLTDSGDTPLCLLPTPSLATSPSSTLGIKYYPDKPCWIAPKLDTGVVEGAPPS